MNEEEKKALKVINARTRRLLDELEIEKEDMSDEPKIAYLMQEIRANKTILNLIEKLLKENEELNLKYSMLYNGKIEKMKAQEVKIKSQVIPVYKVKDKIKKLRAEYEYLGEENKRVNKFEIELLQELIKGD